MQCAADDKWVDVDWGQTDWTPPGTMTRAMRMLRAATAAVINEHSVDEDRIYLTGLSMGGFGCWQWAGASPRRLQPSRHYAEGATLTTTPTLRSCRFGRFTARSTKPCMSTTAGA
ncbi:MAG: hypothetical protein QM775_27300 [Pirellulales bacterium]